MRFSTARVSGIICFSVLLNICLLSEGQGQVKPTRERINLNTGWKFMKYTSNPDKLIYDLRPEITDRNDNIVADSKPTEAVMLAAEANGLKKWILPTANDFIKDPAK